MPLVLRQKDVIIGIVHISINKGGACYWPEMGASCAVREVLSPCSCSSSFFFREQPLKTCFSALSSISTRTLFAFCRKAICPAAALGLGGKGEYCTASVVTSRFFCHVRCVAEGPRVSRPPPGEAMRNGRHRHSIQQRDRGMWNAAQHLL